MEVSAARTPSHNIIAACFVAVAGGALIALVAVPWVALVIVVSAFLGFFIGMHVMAIRTHYWTENRRSGTVEILCARCFARAAKAPTDE